MIFLINPRTVYRCLVAAIGVLISCYLALMLLKHGFGIASIYGLTYLFDLDSEQNIPTLLSSYDLAFASVLLFTIYRDSSQREPAWAKYWCGLSIIFAFLATDEFCSIHEHLNSLRGALHATGLLTYVWVIPYSFLVLVFAATYIRFWWRLPLRSRNLFAISAVIYVVGALCLEMVGAKLESIGMRGSLAFDTEVLFEESMEMYGVALFVFALLELLQERTISIRFSANNLLDGRFNLPSGHDDAWLQHALEDVHSKEEAA